MPLLPGSRLGVRPAVGATIDGCRYSLYTASVARSAVGATPHINVCHCSQGAARPAVGAATDGCSCCRSAARPVHRGSHRRVTLFPGHRPACPSRPPLTSDAPWGVLSGSTFSRSCVRFETAWNRPTSWSQLFLAFASAPAALAAIEMVLRKIKTTNHAYFLVLL